MRGAAATLRAELIGLGGVVERNVYLTRRYIWWDVAFMVWTIANTLTIVFIAKGIEATGGQIDVNRATTTLLIGAVVWAYLGILFEFMTETVAWERWEGTIEYTFMAPLSRAMHLAGAGFFAVLYGLIRAIILFIVVAFFFDLAMPNADFLAAFVVLVVGSVEWFQDSINAREVVARAQAGDDKAFEAQMGAWLAVRMLFRPRKPIKLLGLTVFPQGMIPRHRERLAAAIGKAVGDELVSQETPLHRPQETRLR